MILQFGQVTVPSEVVTVLLSSLVGGVGWAIGKLYHVTAKIERLDQKVNDLSTNCHRCPPPANPLVI